MLIKRRLTEKRLLAVVLAITLTSGAWCQKRQEEWNRCTSDDADASIKACTVLIQAGKGNRAELAKFSFTRGLAYQRKSQNDLAISDFDEAIRLKESQPNLFSHIARWLHILRRAHATEAYPKLAEIFAVRGDAYIDKSEYKRAISDFNRALRIDPNHVAALDDRGNAYRHIGQLDFALSDFNRALSLAPQNALAFNNRGILHAERGDYDLAIADFSESLRIKPNDAKTLSNRGRAYASNREYKPAVADFNESLRIAPNDPATLNARGIAYSDNGEYDLAIADFNEALRLKQDVAIELNNRGNAYVGKREYDLAIADFNESLRIKPNDAETLNNRAIAFSDKREFDLSIADLDQAVRLDPHDADAFNTRGVQFMAKQMFEKALADFDRSVQLKPSHMIAVLHRAAAYDALEKYQPAIVDYVEVIRLASDKDEFRRAEALDGLCWDRTILGQLEQALENCNQGLAVLLARPDHDRLKAATLDSRGFTYLKAGKYDLAIADYDAALLLDEKQATSWYGRGLAKGIAGDNGAATDVAKAEQIDRDIRSKFERWGAPVSTLTPR